MGDGGCLYETCVGHVEVRVSGNHRNLCNYAPVPFSCRYSFFQLYKRYHVLLCCSARLMMPPSNNNLLDFLTKCGNLPIYMMRNDLDHDSGTLSHLMLMNIARI